MYQSPRLGKVETPPERAKGTEGETGPDMEMAYKKNGVEMEAQRGGRNNMRRAVRCAVFVIVGVLAGGCGGNPYLEASLEPAELQGKSQAWFEENWGSPSGKAPRFFGGETWTYVRIAGGKTGPPFGNFSPNTCRIALDFDKDSKLSDYSYSGC